MVLCWLCRVWVWILGSGVYGRSQIVDLTWGSFCLLVILLSDFEFTWVRLRLLDLNPSKQQVE